jgi:NO-binding membrane sensor protein with MHYT domain
MNPVETSFQLPLVAISFLLAVVGSFISLYAARRIVRPDGSIDGIDLLLASISLGGVGVWSMHFVGMLALNIPTSLGYSLPETLVSMVAAVGGTALALMMVARRPRDMGKVVAAGTFLGLGVCVMHYLGMYGMRFPGVFGWSIPLVVLSVVIAIVAATAALWFAFNVKTMGGTTLAALIMGVAVCAMHYTGMQAADFICYTDKRSSLFGNGVLSPGDLRATVFVALGGILMLLIADQVHQNLSRKPAMR